METTTKNSLRQEQAHSLGRMMAGFSHDMKNHIGIIRESNGLMSDLIEMGDFAENEALVERLKKSIDAIERRMVIISKMLHYLSCFAHRADTPYSSFQLNEVVAEENMLLERFYRLEQVELKLELGEDVPTVYNDPSLLQHLFYRVSILCLEESEPGQSIVLSTGQAGRNASLTFRLPALSEAGVKAIAEDNLQAAVSKLEGTLAAGESGHEYIEVTLVIPSVSIEN